MKYDLRNEHWRYFLALEDDFAKAARFIEPCEANMSTYSIELSRLLLASCGEIEIVSKRLSFVNGQSGNWRKTICERWPDLPSSTVALPRYDLKFTPLLPWASDAKPCWWDGYNSIKHKRHLEFDKASLRNTLNALSALLILIIFFVRSEGNDVLSPAPQIFEPDPSFAFLDVSTIGSLLHVKSFAECYPGTVIPNS